MSNKEFFEWWFHKITCNFPATRLTEYEKQIMSKELEELKAAHRKLGDKINELEKATKPEPKRKPQIGDVYEGFDSGDAYVYIGDNKLYNTIEKRIVRNACMLINLIHEAPETFTREQLKANWSTMEDSDVDLGESPSAFVVSVYKDHKKSFIDNLCDNKHTNGDEK